MTRRIPYARAVPIAFALVASAGCWPAASSAQTPLPPQPARPALSDTARLTDEQRIAILDGSTERSAAAARSELGGTPSPVRGIHGEIGGMIGSNGTRGIYGAAEIPLGDTASAAVAFESSRYGYKR